MLLSNLVNRSGVRKECTQIILTGLLKHNMYSYLGTFTAAILINEVEWTNQTPSYTYVVMKQRGSPLAHTHCWVETYCSWSQCCKHSWMSCGKVALATAILSNSLYWPQTYTRENCYLVPRVVHPHTHTHNQIKESVHRTLHVPTYQS